MTSEFGSGVSNVWVPRLHQLACCLHTGDDIVMQKLLVCKVQSACSWFQACKLGVCIIMEETA